MVEMNEQATFRAVIEEVFNNGDYSRIPAYFTADFVEHQFGLHNTYAGMQSDVEKLRTAFPDFHLVIDDMAMVGDKLWVRMTATGTNLGGIMGPPNGKSFRVTVFDEVRFQNGKIVEHWGSPDRFAQMYQLGLLPSPMKA